MSGKRAWDIEPKRRAQVRVSRDPMLSRRAPRAGARATPLGTRRRAARRRVLIIFGIIALAAVGAVIYVLWRPQIRVAHVEAAGAHAEDLRGIAEKVISGSYYFLVPRNSILFVPKESIRAEILKTYPDIDAVSVSRTGLDSIFINASARVSAFTWCGESIERADATCYEADADGLIFAPIPAPNGATGTTTDLSSFTLRLYAPLRDATDTPVRATIANPATVPDALRFVRAMQQLGADVTALELRTDEGDVITSGGTRITYVLGHEQEAANLAASTFPSINVNDGSLQYVDLRFDGKVYYKKKGE
jgi:hypothetical protein